MYKTEVTCIITVFILCEDIIEQDNSIEQDNMFNCKPISEICN